MLMDQVVCAIDNEDACATNDKQCDNEIRFYDEIREDL